MPRTLAEVSGHEVARILNVPMMKKTGLLGAICSSLLGLLVLIASFELFAWLLWHKSYAAIEEVQGVLMVWLGLLAAAYCLGEGLHLAVEVIARRIDRRLSKRWQHAMRSIPGLATAVFGALLAFFGARLLTVIDNTLPGTGWSASILYQPAIVAGLAIAWIGTRQALRESGSPAAVPNA